MGRRNFLVEGVSCTGKTTVCHELRRRGYHAVDGDVELAYQGCPETGQPSSGHTHENHIWRVELVKAIAADRDEAVTFFCGGSRNFSDFLDVLDGVFVLDVDAATLRRRLNDRRDDEWGAAPAERELILRLHQTAEDTPDGIRIDATQPVARVVDDILRHTRADGRAGTAAERR